MTAIETDSVLQGPRRLLVIAAMPMGVPELPADRLSCSSGPFAPVKVR
jgi:hypothetical protein